jgi:hypothetical protein
LDRYLSPTVPDLVLQDPGARLALVALVALVVQADLE